MVSPELEIHPVARFLFSVSVSSFKALVFATTKRAKVSFVFFGQEVAVEFELETLKRIQEGDEIGCQCLITPEIS
ncbi:MAG: hypothetical protein ACUVTO_08090 [Candidatus Caldatribacteriaceae bacterium]